MSLIWKLSYLDGEAGECLFSKLSLTEAMCNACFKKLKMSNRGPANLKDHLSAHSEYLKKFQEMEAVEQSKKKAMKDGLANNAEVKSMLQSCRPLVSHFNHSNLANERLEEEQVNSQLPAQIQSFVSSVVVVIPV
uniref:BED-type domain-containing protein n=1 Tax=Ditylenchus dipsaci TaxID=166011 RepID=A0A915DS72_9BILA